MASIIQHSIRKTDVKHDGVVFYLLPVRPNQSLKLTEIAVDDLTRAKQTVTCWTGHTTRGMDSVAAALRCRSLAPVR